MKKLLVTGATGFVGYTLIDKLLNFDFEIIAGLRRISPALPDKVKQVNVGELLPSTDWSSAVEGVDVVIHTAARVHIMSEKSVDSLSEFRKVNTEGTLNLARQAAMNGVKRFIFISSIKVNGETSSLGEGFLPDDDFVPNDPYGLSKYEAEQGLLTLAKETGMEVIIIRPTLVYGSGVKGNFASLLKWIKIGIPLPFGAIHNKRSFVALDNLVSFIIHCIDHPKAANEIFLISDGKDISTTELLKKVANAFGKKALLLPIPVSLMTLAARLLGKGDVASRLFGSLQVDSSKARDLVNWNPVITMDEQLKKMAELD